MPTTVQSGSPYTSLETDKEILPKTPKTYEIATQTLVFFLNSTYITLTLRHESMHLSSISAYIIPLLWFYHS